MSKKISKYLSMLFIMILATVLVFSFTACGGGSDDDEDSFVQVAGSDGINYTLNDDGESYTMSDLGTCTDSDVVIGNWYNGLPVTGVGEGACRDDEDSGTYYCTVSSITVSEGITDFAFRSLQNWNVEKVMLADGITTFGMAMLRLNTNMRILVIGEGLETIGTDCFSGLNDGQTTIYFRGSESDWNNVTIESGNDVLDTFTIVYDYTGDGTELEAGSDGINYTLNDDGESYTMSDLGTCTDSDVVIGNCYNGLPVTGVGEGACRDDEDSGTYYCTVSSITVTEGITDFAFRSLQNWNVKKVILADGITTFGMAMLRLNTEMTVLVIGEGLETIGTDCFSGLNDGQTTIYFRGSESDWNDVTIESGNDVLDTFTIVYDYTGDGSEL